MSPSLIPHLEVPRRASGEPGATQTLMETKSLSLHYGAPSADRAAAQGWIEKADARDAALAVSRQFAAEAMTALAKPAP